MNKIIDILMLRDGMELKEAQELYKNTRDEIIYAISVGDYELAEDIMMGDFGLEPDYFIYMF